MNRLIFFLLLLPPLAIAHPGMVVSEQRLASEAGAEILRAGGNAIDAAVATGYALAVVNPCCGNIGGGGFMTIHLANGQNIFLNFREKAPLKATEKMYQDKRGNVIPDESVKGYLAVGVPGTVMGFDTALKKYGTLSRKQVMAPAIKLAEAGYAVSNFDAKWFAAYADDFRQQPAVAAIFLKDNKPYRAGEVLVQKDLAHTLTLIAGKGTDVFYKGAIAKDIVRASQQQGGLLTLEDFAKYSVEFLQPVKCTYHDYTIISAPPPSSGGVTLCEMLNILENFPLSSLGYESPASKRYIIEAMRYGFADRNNNLGDPDFVKNPVKKLIDKNYAAEISQQILASPFAPAQIALPAQHESTDTTHYSVVDKNGNAVSVTYTINSFFGAKVIAPPTGFFLNNEMDDFTAKPGSVNQFDLIQGEINSIQPGKRPLSSMTPTIVLKDNKVYLVVGSPGGPRIITSVLLTLLNVLDFGMTLQQAVNAPRFHFQGSPDAVDTEPFAFTSLTGELLRYRGYHLNLPASWSAVEAIQIDPDTGTIFGANDDVRRKSGAAVTQ